MRFRPSRVALMVLVCGSLSSCSPDVTDLVVAPAEVDSCSDLSATGFALAVQLVEAVESAPIEVLTGEEKVSGGLADLLAHGREFDRRISELRCDESVVREELLGLLEDFLPDTLVGQAMLDIMLSDSQ